MYKGKAPYLKMGNPTYKYLLPTLDTIPKYESTKYFSFKRFLTNNANY